MGFARTCSVALVGVEGVVVEVQADLEPGVAAFTLVGLPDKSLTESKDRVRAAVVNSGAAWPQKKLTVGLSPASVPKSGSGFDLAVAAAVLGAAERIDPRVLADIVMIGELGLDGRVRPVRGILPAVLAAADAGYEQVVVPECAAAEAALVPGVSVLGVRSLRQLIAILTDEPVPDEEPDEHGRPDPLMAGLRMPGTGAATGMHGMGAAQYDNGHDLADVVGQHSARTAMEVAAAGGHHVFLEGPPGPARPCSPSGCPPSCPGSPGRSRWRSPLCTRSRVCCHPANPWSTRRPTALRTTRPPCRHSSAAGRGSRGPERCRWLIAECFFLTRPRNSAARFWTRCGSPWRPGT